MVAGEIEDWGPCTHCVIIEGNNEDHWGWTYWVWVIKMDRVIMQNMKHIRHTLVTVDQYLQDQVAKTRKQTPANFWCTDPTNYHKKSYVLYVQLSNNDWHSADSSNDKILA